MDYQELSGAMTSERDKEFAKQFANFTNGVMVSANQTRQRNDQSAPLPSATDVQGVPWLYAPVGIQLSKRML